MHCVFCTGLYQRPMPNWPGGDANEQACLLNMKTQLYAALMEHLLESGSI